MKNTRINKRVFRASVMTVVLVAYLLFFNSYIGYNSVISYIVLIASCILLDYLMQKVLHAQPFARFFYEQEVKAHDSAN